MEMRLRSRLGVIPGLVPGIHRATGVSVRGWLDPGDKGRDDYAVRISASRFFPPAGTTLLLGLAALGLASDTALAHTGVEHAVSFASGFKHPWSGLDHMLAMVAVGLWAGLNGGRAVWIWPVAFVGVMLAGGVLGMAGAEIPMVEPGILGSVILLGLLVLAAARLPVIAGAVLVAAFALLHGQAHGAELPAEAAAATYAAGFAVATALLHGIGLGVAYLGGSQMGRMMVRGAGALVAAAGLALAFA